MPFTASSAAAEGREGSAPRDLLPDFDGLTGDPAEQISTSQVESRQSDRVTGDGQCPQHSLNSFPGKARRSSWCYSYVF